MDCTTTDVWVDTTTGFSFTTGVGDMIVKLHHVAIGSDMGVVFCWGITRASNAKSQPEAKLEVNTLALLVSETRGTFGVKTNASMGNIQPETKREVNTWTFPVEGVILEINLPVLIKFSDDRIFFPVEIEEVRRSSLEINHKRTGIFLIFVKSLSAPIGLILR